MYSFTYIVQHLCFRPTQNTLIFDYVNDKVILSIHNDPIIASTNLQSHLNLQSERYKNGV